MCGCVLASHFSPAYFLSWAWHYINECLSDIIQAHFESRFFHFGDDFLSESKFTQILSGLLVLVLLLLIFFDRVDKEVPEKTEEGGGWNSSVFSNPLLLIYWFFEYLCEWKYYLL